MTKLTLTAPDDWHLHFRDGDILQETVAATARCFKRAIVMPNLVPPITNSQQALAYKNRILAAIQHSNLQTNSQENDFQPLMTIYLTDSTTTEDISQAKEAGIVAAKLYPAGATTNSDAAVNKIINLYPIFEALEKHDMPLLIHGEITDSHIDIFDREKAFIDQHLSSLAKNFPELRIVFEHITTKDAVDFVTESSDKVAATITPQHLLLNRNDLLVGGIHPHNYCLPVLKRNTHQQALRQVVASGLKKFFLGTDSAPHEKNQKESACGCAGCYSAWSALELYAQVFEELGCLDKLEAFASFNGADFYKLPRNTQKITLIKEDWQIPEEIILPNGNPIVPFFAGKIIHWKLVNH